MLPTRPLLTAALLLGAAASQAAPAWSALTGLAPIATSNVGNLGKIATYLDHNGVLHAWSAFTRRWTTLPVSSTATVRLTNDCALVRDGATWTAFSSYGGRFVPLAVSPGAQLVNPSGQDNDSILLVLDQGTLHAFSGFTGQWIARQVSNAALFATQRHVAVLADGNLLAGMDAQTGQWHDVMLTAPATIVSCDGHAATAEDGTTVHGFSGLQRSWTAAPRPATAVRVRNDDWVVWHDGTQAVAFSGLQGTMSTAAFGTFAIAASEDLFGLFLTPAGFVAYSAITGRFSAPLAPPAATPRTSTSVAILHDGLTLTGYSPVLDTAAATTIDSQLEGIAGVLAFAQERATGTSRLYSALTGQWHLPPADAQPTAPLLSTTCALLPTTTGVRAFNARTGSFVPTTGTGFALEANTNSAPVAVWNATTIQAFDARFDRWNGTPRTGTGNPTVQVWRTEINVIDGGTVLGFGAQAGSWHTAAVPEPWIGGRASSESATIVTDQRILAFSAIPETTCLQQFPEFRRPFVAGAALRLQVRLLQGEAAFLAGGQRAATPLALPGLGLLHLDPTTTNVAFVLPDPGEDRRTVDLPVPNQPALRGSEWFFQSLVLPASGTPYLTETGSVLVL